MKYKLFQGWWVRFYFCCALMMSTIVGVLVFAVWAGEDMILWGMGLAGLYAVLWLGNIITRRRFIQGYDWKKVILMPYDERTKPLLDLDAWRCVR